MSAAQPQSGSGARARCVLLLIIAAAATGCTSWSEYFRNGFKVGPNYARPAAPVAERWIDANDPNVRSDPANDAAWWRTFNDPVLDSLVYEAYRQNLTLRIAGLRILEARAQRAIVAGELFPQQQQAFGTYTRTQFSKNGPAAGPELNFDEWTAGANLSWELDFWGRFRRAIESADATLDASVENYDDVLVLLISQVAQSYADLRTAEQRIEYAAKNVVIQLGSLKLAELRFDPQLGGVATKLDVTQAQLSLAQTQATIAPLETARRQAANQLCILLGMPPGYLEERLRNPQLGRWMELMRVALEKQDLEEIKAIRAKNIEKDVPTASPQVAIGIPADLIRRRPDIRRAERQAAAQSALIGVAASDLYPHFAISGTLFLDAERFRNLFESGSLAGSAGPSFRWDILNYGRLVNNIRVQDARFQQLAVQYQNTVLQANAEAENALVGFLNAQQQVKYLTASVAAADESLSLVQIQFDAGKTDFNRVFVVEQSLTQQQDQLAAAQGAVASNLIALYKALGGGWQIRLGGAPAPPPEAPGPPVAPVPPPAPPADAVPPQPLPPPAGQP